MTQTRDGRTLIDFSSNDYLGLSQHEALRDAAIQGARDFGVGSGASPMVSGHSEANAALERELAQFVGLERALYFYAGYAFAPVVFRIVAWARWECPGPLEPRTTAKTLPFSA